MRSTVSVPLSATAWPQVTSELVEILERLYPPVSTQSHTLDRPVIDHTQGARSVVEKLRSIHDNQRAT